jgi:hypothetical protein
MREPRLQRGAEIEVTTTSAVTLPPLVMANKVMANKVMANKVMANKVMANRPRAPVAVLSSTKQTAVIECFTNDGLHKDHGHWCGGPEGKHISGVTVADLARDGMFSVVKNLQYSSARLTERGQWFARTLIEAANEVSSLE